MKLGEVVVHKFHENRMKNKKIFIIDRLMEVSSIKVPLRSCYVVGEFGHSPIELTLN